jgi:hypothetical protein
VPPGLGELSISLESLTEFLRIDGDLLRVAAETSPTMSEAAFDRDDVLRWVEALPGKENDEIIADLVTERDPALIAEMLQRFLDRAQEDNSEKPACGRLTWRPGRTRSRTPACESEFHPSPSG